MIRFELHPKSVIQKIVNNVNSKNHEHNAAAEEVTDSSVEGKPVRNTSDNYTIYIIVSIQQGSKNRAFVEKNNDHCLYLQYSYDSISIDFMFRKHSARKDYVELIRELTEGLEDNEKKVLDLYEEGKEVQDQLSLGALTKKKGTKKLLNDNANRNYVPLIEQLNKMNQL